MPSGSGRVLSHLLNSWAKIGLLGGAIDCGSLSVFGNNSDLASVSSLYF